MKNETEIPAETAAKLIKVTVRHLQRLVKDGWIKKTSAGGYTVVAVVHGYIDSLKHELRRGTRSATTAELHAERAKMLKLKREQLAGKLMLVAEHEALMRRLASFAPASTPSRHKSQRIQKSVDASSK